MECTGKIQNVSKDWMTGKFQITFEINEPSAINEIQKIKDCEKLDIKAVKFRKKRSLDANAYLWVLCTKIAEAISTPESVISKDEVYEEMLQKYGYLYRDDEGYIVGTFKKGTDIAKLPGHWKFYKSNGKFDSYLMIKGSSEYDSVEMARFIDAVVYEAKELDIETATPAELERMKAAWNQQYNLKNNAMRAVQP